MLLWVMNLGFAGSGTAAEPAIYPASAVPAVSGLHGLTASPSGLRGVTVSVSGLHGLTASRKTS